MLNEFCKLFLWFYFDKLFLSAIFFTLIFFCVFVLFYCHCFLYKLSPSKLNALYDIMLSAYVKSSCYRPVNWLVWCIVEGQFLTESWILGHDYNFKSMMPPHLSYRTLYWSLLYIGCFGSRKLTIKRQCMKQYYIIV